MLLKKSISILFSFANIFFNLWIQTINCEIFEITKFGKDIHCKGENK